MRQIDGPRAPLAIVALLSGLALACGGGGSDPLAFTHGVAAGDVTSDGATVWTRTDGGGTLVLEVAADETFAPTVLERELRSSDEHDFTVVDDVRGLDPETTYYYRFRAGDVLSETGTFSTAPTADVVAPVRFVFSGDTDGTPQDDGTRKFDFAVLDAMRAEGADFFLYVGDTIYADSPYGDKAETIQEFRAKYKENRDVERLRETFAQMPMYATWDDHEVENNFSGTTVNQTLFDAGLKAFREYMPIQGETIYRRFRWGRDVELIILDGRSYRDADVSAECTAEGEDGPDLLPGIGAANVPEAFRSFRVLIGLPKETAPACLEALNDPERTLLGPEQKAFLLQALQETNATFKFVVMSVPISELVAQPYDRWEGYRAERNEVLRFLDENDIPNVIFLSTDFHANIVSDVRVNLASQPVGTEFITGPIAHDTLGDDIIESQGEDLVPAFVALLETVPRVACAELDAFAYGLVEVDPGTRTATVTLKDDSGTVLCQRAITAS